MTNPVLLLALAAALTSPPSGRPPLPPLARESPRLYDLRYEVVLSTDIPYGPDDPRVPVNTEHPRPLPFRGFFDVQDAPIVMPVLLRGTFSRVWPESIVPDLWLGDRHDGGVRARYRLDEGLLPHHGHLAVLPIERFRGKVIRWSVSFRAQSYASRIDDQAAAEIAWPREWPADVADGLKPQLYIESEDPIFAETVARVSAGQLRLVPPYLAAKDLVRYCVTELQVSGDGLRRGRLGVLHGMELIGAAAAARAGRGGPHDLVCICVAVLRAAGIPARPVIGVTEDDKGRNILVSWAEFYLPDAGWVPFDPATMRGKAMHHRNVRDPWPEFGTMKRLNRRIPLSYHFIPPVGVVSPQYAALWGWDPRPNGAPNAEQRILITKISRGPGIPDPE